LIVDKRTVCVAQVVSVDNPGLILLPGFANKTTAGSLAGQVPRNGDLPRRLTIRSFS